MLLKTVVNEAFEGAKAYKSHCREKETGTFQNIELLLADVEYDDAFAEALSREIAAYYLHTVFTFDYESDTDSGDGRDDYYTEEEDLPIDLNACIIKDGGFYGVLCESFDTQGLVAIEYPETVIHHPRNYGGKNYHFYRSKRFTLIKK